MSEPIAHLGICDDTFRLALHHPQSEPRLVALMTSHREAAHLGAITRSADQWSAEIIAWARDEAERPEADQDPHRESKLAFVLGALTHRSADRLMKPITRCWTDPVEREETKVMQDLFVFKEVFASGHDQTSPFPADVLHVPTTEAARAADAWFRALYTRQLIAMHTFAPDTSDIHAWLTAFFDRLQTYPRDLELYARLASEWPADKVRKYLTEKRFYRRDDPIIALVRDIQRGSARRPDEVAAAVSSTTKEHSRYARALAKAMDYLLAAGGLYRGELTIVEAKAAFDVGVPELALSD